MSLRLDMIQALARAPKLLGDATGPVRRFISGNQAYDGGFRGRDADGDLYYTVFALELLTALECPLPVDRLEGFLRSFGHGEILDLVHLASLARCWANLSEAGGPPMAPSLREDLAKRLLELRCTDGGFSTNGSRDHGTAYGCFLALAMCQDLGIDPAKPKRIAKCLESLAAEGGGFANEPVHTAATTPSTAAALCAYHMLSRPLPEAAAAWLQGRIHSQGGLCAIAGDGPLCLPDLLSTATALHALSYVRPPSPQPRERHLDFIDSLWDPTGGFGGSWADPTVDCEYTYYGLLALGHLADMP